MSEKLTESITFKCKDDEKLKLLRLAKEKGISLSELVRSIVISPASFVDVLHCEGLEVGLTTGISDTLDLIRIAAITNLLKSFPLDEINRQFHTLFDFLEKHQAISESKPLDQYIPSFELVQQPRMIDVTPRVQKFGTKKTQLCDQLSLICHSTELNEENNVWRL